ncbi:MAG: hypothetical protein Q7R34_11080 [Dehalococcoidia bacterium]|nr:hypothetical protein [Dehalococcoidia bacterium]
MKKGYQAHPEIRRMAEELLSQGYKPARIRVALLRTFEEAVSIATIKRWRLERGSRSPEPFSLADLGLAINVKETNIGQYYSVGTRGLMDLMARYPGLLPEDYMKALAIYFSGEVCRWPDVVELAHEFCRRRLSRGMAIKPLPLTFPPQPLFTTTSTAADVTDARNHWRIAIQLKMGVNLNPREAEAAGILRQIVLDHSMVRMTLPAGGADALYIPKPMVSGLIPGNYTYYYNIGNYPSISDGWYSLKVEVSADGSLTAVNGDTVHLT